MTYNDVVFGEIPNSFIEINNNELRARLGKGFDADQEDVCSLVERCSAAARYRYAYVKLPCAIKGDLCELGFASVASQGLSQMLSGCEQAVVMVLTVGLEVDRLIMAEHIRGLASGYIADAVGSALVESLADTVCERIGENTTNRFSPGYADLPVELNKKILHRLNSESTVGVKLTDGMLMVPMKSITAIVGIKENRKEAFNE